MSNNARLADYDTWLSKQSAFSSDGFIDTDNDPNTLSVKLLWFEPHDSATEVDALTEAASRGITASVLAWPYSQLQLDTATTALWKLISSSAWAGFKVFGILTVDPKAPGLSIEGNITSATLSPSSVMQLLTKLRSLATSVTSVPVQLVPGIFGSNGSTRTTDTSPFYAGGLMQMDNGICSNFFTVMYQGTPRTMTARHCISGFYYSQAQSGDDMYGPSGASDANSQSRLLVGHGTYGEWDGGPQATGIKLVASYAQPGNGIYICTTGGNSGTHCNIEITASVSYNDNSSTIVDKQGVQQSTGSGNIAMMQGDSGGGVFTLTADGFEVNAAGMMQAQGHYEGEPFTGATACGPANDYGTNACGRIVVETPISKILADYPASIYTGP